jgi:hypothetical protein
MSETNVLMDLKYACQQYFTCMCFLGFIRYNKTFIACGFRKYENVFTHEYHIPLGRCPQEIWYSWVNKFSYFPHQHAIITLLPFFIEMWQYDWLWSGHMIIKVMFHIPMKLKSELARASSSAGEVICAIHRWIVLFRQIEWNYGNSIFIAIQFI